MRSVYEGAQTRLGISSRTLLFLLVRILVLYALQQRILTLTCRSGLIWGTSAQLEKLSDLLLGNGLYDKFAEGHLRPLNHFAALNVSTINLKHRLAAALVLKQVFKVKVSQKLRLDFNQFLQDLVRVDIFLIVQHPCNKLR